MHVKSFRYFGPVLTEIEILSEFYLKSPMENGARGGVVIKALRYKPAGRGFDSRWCHWNFSVT